MMNLTPDSCKPLTEKQSSSCYENREMLRKQYDMDGWFRTKSRIQTLVARETCIVHINMQPLWDKEQRRVEAAYFREL